MVDPSIAADCTSICIKIPLKTVLLQTLVGPVMLQSIFGSRPPTSVNVRVSATVARVTLRWRGSTELFGAAKFMREICEKWG
jgi:hypothetical protein